MGLMGQIEKISISSVLKTIAITQVVYAAEVGAILPFIL